MTQPTEQPQTPISDTNAPGSGTPDPASNPVPAAQPGADKPAEKAARPDWLPEQFWDADGAAIKGADLKSHLDDLVAFKAGEDSRRAAVPEKPDSYELKLPADLKFAEGESFELNPDDPMVAFGREVAHAAGLDQAGFEKLVGLYAQREIAQAKANQQAFAQQLEALGPKGADRQKAMTNWIGAKLGPDAVVLFDHLLKFKVGVETLERIQRMTGGGGAPFTQAGRDVAGKDKIDGWDDMSPAQKMAAARR